MKSTLFCLGLTLLAVMARGADEPQVDPFISSRVDSASLAHATHACFIEEQDFFAAKPLEVTPVFFSSTLNANSRVTEYVLCMVKALPFDDGNEAFATKKDLTQPSTVRWFILLGRTKYESLELWTLCAALEEGKSPRYKVAALKLADTSKMKAHAVYELLAEWGALGAFGSEDLWQNHKVLGCSLDIDAWNKHVDATFDLARLHKK